MDLRKRLRKIPAEIKILALFASGFIIFALPILPCAAFIFALSIFSSLAGLGFRSQFSAQKPAFSYAIALYALHIFEQSFFVFSGNPFSAAKFFLPDATIVTVALRIFAALQCTVLLYHTTTQLEIRTGIITMESAIRRIFCQKSNVRPAFSQSISLMLAFIPEILSAWRELNRAWKARGGKNGLSKMTHLVPALLSLCMHRAYKKALAVAARNPT